MADLSHKQWTAWEYLEDRTHTEVLYGGAAGGGKSWLGALWLLTNALRYQGSRYLMGRAVGKTLKETTLQSFFDVCSAHGMKAGQHYTYNSQTGQIAIGASTILLKDLFAYPSDPNFDDLGSLEITGAFIDEANQITAKAKAIVSSRIRYKLDEFGLIPKLLMSCNPARNWVHAEFYQPHRDGTLEPHRAFVPALVTDNPNISSHYIDNLKRLTGAARARLLLGDWDYDNDPSRMIEMDAIHDLFTNDHAQPGPKYITADIARYGSDRTVIGLWDGYRLVHLTVMDRSSVVECAAAITSLSKLEGVGRSCICVDDDGVGGGVVDLLPGCYAFKNGGRPIDLAGKGENYANLKAQCSYIMAQLISDRMVGITTDAHRDAITEELSHLKREGMDKDGKLRVLGKDKVKEALGRSPDFSDMIVMRGIFELLSREPVFVKDIVKKARKQRHEQFVQAVKNTWR